MEEERVGKFPLMKPTWMFSCPIRSRSPWPSCENLFDIKLSETGHADHNEVCFYGNDPTLDDWFVSILGNRIKMGLRTSIVGGLSSHNLIGNVVVADTWKLTSFTCVVIASEHAKIELPLGVITCLERNGFDISVIVIDDGYWTSIVDDYRLCTNIPFFITDRDTVRSQFRT
jgi:hypothetical protein